MTEQAAKRFPVLLIGSLMLCVSAASFETSSIFAAMSRLIAEFGDPNTAGWLITAYLLVGAGVAAVMGRLGDLYGRREIMLLLLAVGVGGSLISAFSSDFMFVLLGRCLQGLTGALLPLCFGLIRQYVPARQVPLSIGLMVSGAGIGVSGGLIVGGLIVDSAPWRGIFIASASLTTIAVVAGLFAIPKTRERTSHPGLDIWGGVLFVPGVALVLLAVSKGMSWGWFSAPVLVSVAAGVAFLVGWALRSATQDNPLVDVRLFANRNILLANLCMAALAIGALQITQVFSLLVQQDTWTGVGLGMSATSAGLIKLPSNIIALVAGPVAGILATRVGDRFAIGLAAVLTAAGWFVAIWFHGSIPATISLLIVISFGTTMAYALIPAVVVNAAPEGRTSEATGMLYVTRATFSGIGAQLVAILMSVDTVSDPGTAAQFPTEFAYQVVFLSVAVVSAVVALLAMGMSVRRLCTASQKVGAQVQEARL